MANEKISQMPLAASLSGSELIELVQNGVNVQGTVATIVSGAGNPAANFGNPSQPFGSGNGSIVRWACMTVNPQSGAFQPGIASDGNTSGWTSSGSSGGISANFGTPGSSTIYATSGFITLQTSTGSTNAASQAYSTNYGPTSTFTTFRVLSPTLPIAGFSTTFYCGLDTYAAGMTLFFGMRATGSGTWTGSQVPSAGLQTIGFSLDSGDTTIQFIYNNGGGNAVKTNTGITPAAITRHMLKVVITCDVLGNVTASLIDLEAGGAGTVTYTVPTATAKLPAANATIQPTLYISTGTQTTIGIIAIHSIFTAVGFVQ